jgi:DNA-binding transcriptional regulator GbsR (MarR family)
MTTSKVELPKEILENAVNLRNAVRLIYIELYLAGKPTSADDVAKLVHHARAYVNMRLNQLEDMGKIKSIHDGKTKLYEVVT